VLLGHGRENWRIVKPAADVIDHHSASLKAGGCYPCLHGVDADGDTFRCQPLNDRQDALKFELIVNGECSRTR